MVMISGGPERRVTLRLTITKGETSQRCEKANAENVWRSNETLETGRSIDNVLGVEGVVGVYWTNIVLAVFDTLILHLLVFVV